MRAFDFSQNLRGVSVLLRASLNVPTAGGVITNTFRLEEALPTISKLAAAHARTVILAHIGRSSTDSLEPVFNELARRLGTPLFFSPSVVGSEASARVQSLVPGAALLLENVRREAGEEANDSRFADALASYGSVYINDAFSDSHRAHASIVGIPQFIPGFAGVSFMREVSGLAPALSPKSPSIAIVGGAKFSTKEPLIRTLVEKYDHVFIGGALAHDFFLARGFDIGTSFASRNTIPKDMLATSKILLPTDVVVVGVEGREAKPVESVVPTDCIYDVGPQSIARITPLIQKARTILWNGPLGNFEKGFSEGTEALARIIASASGVSVVGGGDTIAAIEKLGLNSRFTHISTGGGAMLQFIAEGTLPGITALG